MNDFNNIENIELDAMRQQLSELKERIERTTTLNEKLMHESIKGKMRGVHKRIIKMIIMGTIALPLWVFIGYYWNLPWYFTAFTIVMLSASMLAGYVINRMDVDHMADNMADTARQLVKMKRMRVRHELIGIPVVILWLAWFMWELFHSGIDHDLAMSMCVGGIIGAVIGACLGLHIFFGLQRSNDEMLRQIEELGK